MAAAPPALHQAWPPGVGWHPTAERLLWRSDLQEPKRSRNGQDNVRHRADVKRAAAARVRDLVARRAPWLQIRYAFTARIALPCRLDHMSTFRARALTHRVRT